VGEAVNEKTITEVILDVLEHGDEDDQPWAFYENPDPRSYWNKENAEWERKRFIDTVIRKYNEEAWK